MKVKSKCLKIRNLPADGEYLGHVNSKPYLFIFVCLAIGVALLPTIFYMVGILMCLVFLYCLIFVKNIKLIEFYTQYAFFFLNNGNDECFLLFWDDVAKWNIESQRNDLDILHIDLKDGQTISLKCLGRKKIVRYFEKYVPVQKQEDHKQQHA